MKIKRIIGGDLYANSYIIVDEEGRECFIIDPGYSPEKHIAYIEEERLTLNGILLTHNHYDHTGAVKELKNVYDVPVYIHKADMNIDGYNSKAEVILKGGEKLLLGKEVVDVISTPGHTEGSVCFYSSDSGVSFTGDTVFNVDLGRTDLAGGSFEKMEESIKNIVNRWSDDIIIYPGHGDECSMQYVRENNREFLDIIGEENGN